MANGATVPSPSQDDKDPRPPTRPPLRRSDSRTMPPARAVRKRVGGYVVGETVGEGSFGKVRMGTHTLTGERVAMKIIDKKLIAKREYVRKNLRREAVVLQRLTTHPNIIRLYEVLETTNNYYLVMEYAEGGQFMRYLCERKRLSERETRKFMRQLVSAVDYMHQAEVVHRDIKIENFLLDEDSNLKVIDFGLSNILGADGLLKTQCGSPAYAAPEIFCNSSYGPAVDVWSIGVNMFAMLTGELPFTVDPPTNMTKLHAKIIEGCTIPQHLTRDCRDLLSRLLTANETERISLRDIMRHPWINRGYTRRLYPAQFPNRITDEQLDLNIISSLVASGFAEAAVRDAVTQNKPIPETAGYHLLRSRVAKGWGYPEGSAPTTNENGGSDGDDVIDLESVSAVFTPSPTGQCSRPGSSAGSRTGSNTKMEPERAKSQMAQKQRTVEQEARLKSAPTPNKIKSGPLLVDARKHKANTRGEDSPTREIIVEDMRKKLAHYLEKDSNNNEIKSKEEGPLIVITSLDETLHSDKPIRTSGKEKSTDEVATDEKENDNIRYQKLYQSSTPSRKDSTAEAIQQTVRGRTAQNPGRAAVEQGCMIIVNGKLAKGSLFSDALKQRSAWTSEALEGSSTPVPFLRSGAGRKGPGLRRSRTDPGAYSAVTRGTDRDRLLLPQNGEAHAPYQSHGAFPAHRLGLYYSVTRQLRHYPGTCTHRRNTHEGGQTTRARSHTAPNGRPLLGLMGAQVMKSAPLPSNNKGLVAAARTVSGKDLTLPRINVDRMGWQGN